MSFTITDDKPPTIGGDAPRRPGRPKGSTNKPAAKATGATDASTLRQALATMDSLYEFTAMGLLMVGLTETASEWATKVEDLKKSNENSLKAAPRLAAMIANAGSVGGATTFLLANGMAFGSVALTARGELNAKRAATMPDNVTEIVPGAADFTGFYPTDTPPA